jgi:membrane protein YdbS with pleckstrin-like domain
MTASNPFTNDSVDMETLPSASDISFDPVSPRYGLMLVLLGLLVWLGPTLGWSVLYGTGRIESSVITGTAGYLLPLVALPFVLAGCLLTAKHTGYSVRQRDVHMKRGVIWRTRTALPFNRIQHVEMERGPVERYFKLATLKFFTAGGGSADMKIPALPVADAARLKDYVLARAGATDERA